MAKKAKMKTLKKGERCGDGFERVTLKVGKRTVRGCIRIEEGYAKAKKPTYNLWDAVLAALSGMGS